MEISPADKLMAEAIIAGFVYDKKLDSEPKGEISGKIVTVIKELESKELSRPQKSNLQFLKKLVKTESGPEEKETKFTGKPLRRDSKEFQTAENINIFTTRNRSNAVDKPPLPPKKKIKSEQTKPEIPVIPKPPPRPPKEAITKLINPLKAPPPSQNAEKLKSSPPPPKVSNLFSKGLENQRLYANVDIDSDIESDIESDFEFEDTPPPNPSSSKNQTTTQKENKSGMVIRSPNYSSDQKKILERLANSEAEKKAKLHEKQNDDIEEDDWK